jgi:hypothetical protein
MAAKRRRTRSTGSAPKGKKATYVCLNGHVFESVRNWQGKSCTKCRQPVNKFTKRFYDSLDAGLKWGIGDSVKQYRRRNQPRPPSSSGRFQFRPRSSR